MSEETSHVKIIDAPRKPYDWVNEPEEDNSAEILEFPLPQNNDEILSLPSAQIVDMTSIIQPEANSRRLCRIGKKLIEAFEPFTHKKADTNN